MHSTTERWYCASCFCDRR